MTSKTFETTIKNTMKSMLAQCTPEQQDIFRKMYDHKNEHENPVDAITPDKMDWAFKQIERTLESNEKKAAQ